MSYFRKFRVIRGHVAVWALWLFLKASKFIGLKGFADSFCINFLKKNQLFDRGHYLKVCPYVKELGISPLRHYITVGDGQGIAPSPLFDPEYYRSHAKGISGEINSLLHYLLLGRYQLVSPSEWFDAKYYLNSNPDVYQSGCDPVMHYLNYGGVEGRSPSPGFDGRHYLVNNPDVSLAGVNPLLHYLGYGRFESRRFQPVSQNDLEEGFVFPVPSIPRSSDWVGLLPRVSPDARVDVIVPVYKGYSETLNCIYSVLSVVNATDFCLVVINDGSPDSKLVEKLRELAADKLFVFLENSSNLGFVRTVNLGMKLNPERDVILLNSDTEVYGDWVDRLLGVAESNSSAATITPLSNNATICSYPHFPHDNPVPLELDYAELDELTASVNDDEAVSAPSGVGFCFYIRRACLNQIGFFDEQAFGKGYGEENDFCLRAEADGWVNLIAANIFVRHWGSTSFGAEKEERVNAALKVLRDRYPSYHEAVAKFIQADPLSKFRERLDWARLKRYSKEKNVLIICHDRGGGTERHIQEDVVRLQDSGYGVFFLRPHPHLSSHGVLSHETVRQVWNLPLLALEDCDALIGLWKCLNITELHTHGLVDFSSHAPLWLSSAVARFREQGWQLKWEVNLHDYKVICPRITLTDEQGHYCGEPVANGCNNCLKKYGSSFGVTDIAQWREQHEEALLVADNISVPDEDMRKRLHKYFDKLSYVVSPHEVLALSSYKRFSVSSDEKVIKVIIIGAISQPKGFDVLLSTAGYVKKKKLPFSFLVLGYTMDDVRAQKAGIDITGKYNESEALGLLQSMDADLVWLPSLWPETYSYTLSLALQANVPVMAFDLGAIARRLRELDRSELLIPLNWAYKPDRIIDNLLMHGAEKAYES